MKPKVTIRKADINDAEGKGYVHYHSWNESYTGLIDQEYLDLRSLERCIEQAKEYPENTYVALVDEKIIGFSCYLEYRDDDLEDSGEINAIYLLKDYNGLGIGKKLMEVCFEELKQYSKIALWVLKSNSNAIGFYEHIGFERDGKEKNIKLKTGAYITEVRMILKKGEV